MIKQSANAVTLEREIAWFSLVLDARFHLYFQQNTNGLDLDAYPAPDLSRDESEYARVVRQYQMDASARIVLILTLIPHLRPQILDLFFTHNKNIGRGFTEFGGWKGKMHGGLMPTCETAAFILTGSDLQRRFEVMQLFEDGHFFIKQGIIKIDHQANGEPFWGAALIIGAEYLNRFTTGRHDKPDYSSDFPAKLITTRLDWNDLVLDPEVQDEIENIKTWINSSGLIMQRWGLEKAVKPGYRSLFYGPPGTGKTLTATLIGASTACDVYRIDLSMVVSKYIGETEKNLANVFDQAQNKNWILFFDEADALFGKRTQASSSNDRHANQEISYLLQRVEDFPGVVILATNLKANIDEAFARRFQTAVYFPMPDAIQRLRLWQGMLRDSALLDARVDLPRLAEKYEIAGGAIINVVRYAAIRAMRRGSDGVLMQDDLIKGIAKELTKEGRTL